MNWLRYTHGKHWGIISNCFVVTLYPRDAPPGLHSSGQHTFSDANDTDAVARSNTSARTIFFISKKKGNKRRFDVFKIPSRESIIENDYSLSQWIFSSQSMIFSSWKNRSMLSHRFQSLNWEMSEIAIFDSSASVVMRFGQSFQFLWNFLIRSLSAVTSGGVCFFFMGLWILVIIIFSTNFWTLFWFPLMRCMISTWRFLFLSFPTDRSRAWISRNIVNFSLSL